jgi:hypothetical protein
MKESMTYCFQKWCVLQYNSALVWVWGYTVAYLVGAPWYDHEGCSFDPFNLLTTSPLSVSWPSRQHLSALQASRACYRDSFTFTDFSSHSHPSSSSLLQALPVTDKSLRPEIPQAASSLPMDAHEPSELQANPVLMECIILFSILTKRVNALHSHAWPQWQ